MEAFLTSGGCSTLPYTYRDRIGHLDYKTIRYPGHCSIIKALVSLGLAGTDVVSVGSARVVPRDLLVTLLKRQLPSTGPDVVLLKAWGIGSKEGTSRRLDYGLVDYHDPLTGLSAMMRTTGFPVSIIAELIRKDVITARGVYTPEEIVPFAPLRRELATRGVRLTRRMT
jgi:lysine 6-dehydrogenase